MINFEAFDLTKIHEYNAILQHCGERCWKKSRYYFSEICKTKLVN